MCCGERGEEGKLVVKSRRRHGGRWQRAGGRPAAAEMAGLQATLLARLHLDRCPGLYPLPLACLELWPASLRLCSRSLLAPCRHRPAHRAVHALPRAAQGPEAHDGHHSPHEQGRPPPPLCGGPLWLQHVGGSKSERRGLTGRTTECQPGEEGKPRVARRVPLGRWCPPMRASQLCWAVVSSRVLLFERCLERTNEWNEGRQHRPCCAWSGRQRPACLPPLLAPSPSWTWKGPAVVEWPQVSGVFTAAGLRHQLGAHGCYRCWECVCAPPRLSLSYTKQDTRPVRYPDYTWRSATECGTHEDVAASASSQVPLLLTPPPLSPFHGTTGAPP